MRQVKVVLAMVLAVFSFTAVNAQTPSASINITVANTVYQCPMKCEGDKTYDKEGKCPKCNMNLKKVEITKIITTPDGHIHN